MAPKAKKKKNTKANKHTMLTSKHNGNKRKKRKKKHNKQTNKQPNNNQTKTLSIKIKKINKSRGLQHVL